MILKNYESLDAFLAAINKYRKPPADAIKQQTHGARLSSINPQWRVDALTDILGPYGIGWWTESEAGDWKAANVNCVYVRLRLCYRVCIGGEEVTANTGWHTGGTPIDRSDEAVKMAETDALGKAVSYLGIGAAIYRGESDGDKYSKAPARKPAARPQEPAARSQDSQASDGPMARSQPSPGDPGSFIVPFGRSKGRMIRELSVKENQSSLDWLEKNGKTGDYRDALEAYLDLAESSQLPSDEELPF